jgi:hypothetical protein
MSICQLSPRWFLPFREEGGRQPNVYRHGPTRMGLSAPLERRVRIAGRDAAAIYSTICLVDELSIVQHATS